MNVAPAFVAASIVVASVSALIPMARTPTRVLVRPEELLDENRAVDARQTVISHDHLRLAFPYVRKRLFGASHHPGGVTVELENLGDVISQIQVVVDDEYLTKIDRRHRYPLSPVAGIIEH